MKLSIQTTYDFTPPDASFSPNPIIITSHDDGTWSIHGSDLEGGVSIMLTTSQVFTLLADLTSALTKGGSK